MTPLRLITNKIGAQACLSLLALSFATSASPVFGGAAADAAAYAAAVTPDEVWLLANPNPNPSPNPNAEAEPLVERRVRRLRDEHHALPAAEAAQVHPLLAALALARREELARLRPFEAVPAELLVLLVVVRRRRWRRHRSWLGSWLG